MGIFENPYATTRAKFEFGPIREPIGEHFFVLTSIFDKPPTGGPFSQKKWYITVHV